MLSPHAKCPELFASILRNNDQREVSHAYFSSLVHLVRGLLAAGAAGPDCLSLRMASPLAISNRRDRRPRGFGDRLGSRDAAGSLIVRAVSSLTCGPKKWAHCCAHFLRGMVLPLDFNLI